LPPHLEIVSRKFLDASVHLLSDIRVIGRLIDMTECPKGRPRINVPEVGNDADTELDNVCRRVSVEIAKGRLNGLGFGDVSVDHRPQQRGPQLRIDRREVVIVGENVLAKRSEDFVPLVVVGRRVKCFDRAAR
jgi:hypothetical protein